MRLTFCFLGALFCLTGAQQPPGPGPGDYSTQMQSRAVDTRVTFEIKEGQPKGTLIGKIPTKPGFIYRFNEPPKEFSMDAKTGEIRTNAVLDRENLKNDRYDLVVLSSQPTYPIEVRILVLDINDNPPEFPEPSISVSFSESAAAGTRLLLDAATDKDIGTNGVSDDYRIIDGNKDDKFRLALTVNPAGETSYLHLETTGKLDRESQGFYFLNISARDGGAPPKFGYLQVNVTILDVNDNPPIFDHSDYIVSLNESVLPGTPVLQVMATDNDLGDNAKITYYLADTERQFTVDPETGVISTTETLECPQQNCPQTTKSCPKSCVFTVFARDHGSPRQDGRTYVTVNLVDANDHDPVIKFRYFPFNAMFATVDENAGNGSVVAAVSVVDSDEGLNGETTVRIVSGNELNHFRLDYTPSFDIVRVNGVLDREEISKYNLTVVATDKGTPPRTATAFLIIHVNDVNDHEPVFEKSEYSAILSELAPSGTYVAGITATDEDSGVNAQIYYAFVSGNEHQWFSINSDTGLITTRDILDREVQGTVELNISARDGGPNPKWAYTQLKVTILDENDEAPRFSQSKFNVSLSENAPPGTLIAMLTASDHDQGTNGSVAYSLHPVTQQHYDNVLVLDSLTGQLTTRKKLDREEISHYEIHVIAKDQGLPPQSSTATVYLNVIDVNDNSPEFYPLNYFVAVPENVKPGSSLVKVTASDRDEGENAIITYNLESGGDDLFTIDEWTGVITIRGDLKWTKPIHRLKISAKDHGDKRAAEDATVEIIKERDLEELLFDNYGYEFKIVEDDSDWKRRNVGQVHVRNTDVTYSIVYGDPEHSFDIDERTGKITTAKKIDREQTLMYSLTITARVGLAYGKTLVNVVVLDLNDNKPVFDRDKDEVKLAENAAVGQEVYLARARDLDAGINSRVTYHLNYNPDDQFRISEATGVIYLNRPIRAEPGLSLHVEVTASDGGEPPLSSKQLVRVVIEDVNDHTPVFDHTSYETSLLESTPVNERFFALAASDTDLGLNGRISYVISEGNTEGKFGIFPDGFLYVRQSLDREDKDYYSLSVTASDLGNPSRSSVVPVVIHVIDENDNSPEFTNASFSFNIRENEPPDSFVGKLTATDRDIGRNAELIFSLSNSQSDFVIDPKNGFIKTLHVFDREELVQTTGLNYLSLEATVTDNGSPRLRDKVKVNVYVTDVNDNPPKFLRTPYRVQVSEGSPVGTQVIRLFTSDADEGLNGDVFYSIVQGNDDGRFTIEEATGQIILSKILDRETVSNYLLTVVARDAGQMRQLSSTTTVSVEVMDENDNSPEFTQTNSKISVIETTPVNTELIQFRATDADLGMNSEVVFSISAGNRKDTFHVDPSSGTLYLHKPLDYEELSAYQLNITASDNGNPRLSTTILFAIAVEDANDNPPSFPSTAIVRQIREGISVHTPIVTVTADDPDYGINGKVTYAISQQEPEDSNRHFGINPVTGVIHTLLPIDRETIDTFRLTVVATDEAQPASARLSANKLVTVIVEDVNDNAPVFVSMNSAILPQNTQFPKEGALIMNVFARDLDSATNGLVTYELASGSPDLFRLDQSSGALRLVKPIEHPEPTYRLSVKATDEAVQNERKSSEAYLTIIATDFSARGPSFESGLFTGSVFENEPPGTSILTVSASFDSGEVEYYVTNVTGDGAQVDRLFDIDTKLGVLSTATQLDREQGVETYEVEVYAIVASGSPKTNRTKIQIKVLDKNDSPPSFKDTPLYYSISEDLGPGQSVATVKADDPDTIGVLEYSLIRGDDGHFVLDKNTGVLTLVDSLDRETKDVYKLTVRASDGNQHTDTVLTVQITDTNDNPPAFLETAYSFDIPENAQRGHKVGQVKAVDADLGINAQLTYSVISDWANDVFSLNPQTGVFTLTSRLDYEEVQHYILVVQAQDAGHPALSSTLTVYCNVLDLNDNTPLFDPMSYTNEIFENVSIATPIVTVSATDLDSGDNGKIVFRITAGDENGDFEMTPNGTVITKKELDRERQGLYNLVVTATDQAKPPDQRLSSTVQVTIILKDVNDMSPEFVTPNETSVAENIAINTVVMAVKAIDKDEGRNGYIEYSLSPDSASSGTFSLGPVDGLLRVSGRIDRETKSNYTLSITARDRGDPPRATHTKIFVRILDENDNSPVFDPKQYSASIAENASIGASVLQVSATDVDDGLNGRVRYSINSGDTNRDFSIAEDTGVVRVAKNLNYERKSRYVLTVRAEDCAGDVGGEVVRADTAEIVISVSDINDNPPTFLDSPYLAYVMENTIPPNGGYVITVQAYDADTPPLNSLVRYFIKEGKPDTFKINASTGEISLLRALDREAQAEYTLSLGAMDTGSPPLTGTGTVKIIVQDVNDHTPEFKRQSYHATINENSPLSTWVVTPTATDKDIGLNAKIRYSLLGDKVDRFKIDQDAGIITTSAILDREETEIYYFTVMAQDCSATEPRAAAVNLTITVTDENDNSPSFSSTKYEVNISDKTKAGEFVFGARASDDDIGINSKISYALTGEHAPNFTINPETGVIKAAQDLAKLGTKVFNLEIEAADGGKKPRKTSTELRVFLRPDHLFPSFTSPGKTRFVLAENVEHGKLVARFKATSPKKGAASNVRYAIAGGNIGEALTMDKNTGEVHVAGRGLDYETLPVYEVWIEAKDSDVPPLRTVLQLTINVTDANDNSPVFNSNLYNASILEEESPPQLVVKVSAEDLDSGENGQVTYKLTDDFDGTFEIDSESGEIYTNARLDREETPAYELTVEALDQGVPQMTGTATVLVTVLDKNDNPPRFSRLFSVNVTENADLGSFVIQVTSSDKDIGDNANATYSFTENPGEKFKIDPISGNVTVVGHLDREQQDEYLLKVAAVDGAWKAETPLTITIQDQNDNAPEFEHSFYSFNFPELQRDVVFVGQVAATDRDKQGPNSVISYSLQQPSDLFTVDPASGDIFSKRSLRFKYTQMEASPENMYSLTILATDNGKPPMSSECLVTVNVVDANNNAPKFDKPEYLSPVPDDAQEGQLLLKVTAKDKLDFGVNAEINYVIVGGNGSENFAIDKYNGWITLTKPVTEIGQEYLLRVRAIDKGVPPQHDEVTVTLVVTGENKYMPVFTALSYQVIVPENEPLGSTILTVNASDDDQGPNGMIRYKISGGNERKEFAVDPYSGAVTILQPLDYDTIQEYHLNITAEDLGFKPQSTTAMLTITLTDINDNSPTFNQSIYEAYISENLPPNSFVFQVKATDIDSPKNAIIQYSISDGPDKDMFAIDQKTGRVTAKYSFDYEENDLYTINIVASNPDSPMFGIAELRVHINGVNEYYPRFIQPVFHFDVSESAEVGTQVGTVQATDQDAGDDGKVYYLFVGSSNDRGFNINSESGVISVSRSLDRETQSRIVLTIMAKNAGGIRGNDTDEAQVIVEVQDGNDPPEFLQTLYEVEISEGAPVGSKVTAVKAVDKDVRPQNNQFSYSIIGGNIEQAFKIDPQSGQIETARFLDRETTPEYSLVVGGIDTGLPPQTGTTTVKIHITDINDNGPTFDPRVVGKVLENEPPNTKIMTLSAKDPDLPPNGAPFTYKLIGGKHRDFVKIDKHSGVVVTTKMIDREVIPQLEILVEVEDSGSPKMKSQHVITIEVLDQNDSPSSARSVHVLVYAFNGVFPVGKIADVHPNDPDIVGDYKCKILQAPASSGILSIPSGCNLFASKVSPGQGYSLSVSGNDGKHFDVVSTVTVEFVTFSNETVDHSITIKISNVTSQQFLAQNYRGLLDILKTSLSSGETVLLYGLHDTDDGLELTLAVKSGHNYHNKDLVVEKLRKKRESIGSLFQTSDVSIGYTPCNENTCQNGGICTAEITVKRNVKITDSQNIVFTSPVILHEYNCQCADGFAGKNCNKRQDPCQPNPCKSGGQCRRQGFNFHCICPLSKDGKYCETERGDACSENPCQNGGSCRQSPDGSSFFCLCRPGYRGNQCEALADSCRPNPCLHGGLCVSLKPGYKCSCTDGRYGRHCEKSTFGFGELSYMAFPSLDAATNDITFIFSTTKPNSLLVYNYGLQTGGRSDFVAVELVNGRAVFSFGGSRTAVTSISVGGRNNNLADGSWYKIIATRNGRVVSLSVASCTEHGDVCEECRPNDNSCYADDIGPAGTLNFNNQLLLIGGLNSADPVLERPGQIHSDDLVGCVHSVSVNGRLLNLSHPLHSDGIQNTCIRKGSCRGVTSDPCMGYGTCLDHWSAVNCDCGNNLIAPNCHGALQPISLSDGAFVEFAISKKHKRMQLLEIFYGGSTLWKPKQPKESPSKSVSFLFRTVRTQGVLFYATSNKQYTSVELIDGQIIYMSKLSNSVNMTEPHVRVTDGQWHNLTLHSHSRVLEILLNGVRIGDELDSEGVHDFLDPYLTYLSLGGAQASLYYARGSVPLAFEGCITNFTVNNEIQPFNGSGSIFTQVIFKGKVTKDCNGPIGVGAAATTDPLSIGITLVIVFFVVLLVAILVSFVVFRLRKQHKEKGGAPGSPSGLHSKQNGSATMMSTNGLNAVNDNILGRSLHSGDNSLGYHSENGDVIRGIGGHSLVGPELLSKKYKERDIIQGELTRPQRPDIIEREVSKNLPMREEHHPPLPPTSNHNHDHGGNDLNSEIPEHYDLENASSIAPSDIDIVYHYKGYREAGGVRKYKATPPPVAGYHHKHASGAQGQAQHRHSPHHPTGYPPRAPPVTSPGSRPHQSTPLARLSPSSEMSAQQPRILTLHDISGKPLQSALLATTSSSGGVGKDVLHSNSERSLNSPVMSQLSGQSSSSRKAAAPPPVTNSLTAEEIERLNSRPRTSSLVSTLDAVSSSSEAPRGGVNNHLNHLHHSPVPETHHSSTTTDESGNDSFTCSEIEYDNASLAGDKYKSNEPDSRRNDSSSGNKNNLPLPSYDGFDSSYRGSMSTLVASDDELEGPMYRPSTGSPSTTGLGWDYLLNWGPNFESLAGVFKDIAELPDSVNGRVPSSLRLTNAPKPSEEYV
ncbi:cadherin-related tumor suppressor [Tribolium castaneum]|uniref:Cadherin-related tumor suppressor-like Protein n=1 Tax=Tribolium castaneum TaxID=7070 RepID=A0A139WIU3_TRICA|nr:PREDICTED: cadherin-related tumor suppressor [Tribolium castaneum]KYB27849.1 Cadherin-related tumor suppressor-like Protein [Tribolium castaneum]|eukprot:XP_971084.2 PREDICTED: cadherin-related tumor suppressor [Tribolium castaneum]